MARSWLPIVFVAACGGSPKQTPVGNAAASTPSPTPDAPLAADDCEPPSTSDETPYGVHAIEIQGGSGPAHPYRWADASGKILAVPFLFDNGPDYWQEGFSRIVDTSGKMGFIDEHGTIVVPPSYDFVYPFCHGVAKIARGGVGGYIDRTGAPTAGPAEDPRPLIPERHVD